MPPAYCIWSIRVSLTKRKNAESPFPILYFEYINHEKTSWVIIPLLKIYSPVFKCHKKSGSTLKKVIENKYTVDSPFGLCFDNEIFKDYVRNNNLPIDLEDLEENKWYLESRTLRGLINDHEYNLTFEQLEGLINHLNKFEKEVDKHINFDEYVAKHTKIRK